MNINPVFLYRCRDVARHADDPSAETVLPVSRSTWLAMVKEGRAPQPVRLGARAVAWRGSDLLAFLERLA